MQPFVELYISEIFIYSVIYQLIDSFFASQHSPLACASMAHFILWFTPPPNFPFAMSSLKGNLGQ